MCSNVPDLEHALQNALKKLWFKFKLNPLQSTVKKIPCSFKSDVHVLV